mmetsp:Transcript_27509/g.40646  ORF Transcript_27509/g.40646 Transcript_27509/m.40646 type:complete len:151 (-) Transcript_27509:1346-1798(-)
MYMMRSFLFISCFFTVAIAFSTSFLGQSRITAPRSNSQLQMKVVDIDSETAFDKTIESASGALVVVDYSTTWCGPCKVIAPKFDEFSEKYPNAVFLKVIGDASPDASKLMKREGVRSVPSFHYFVDGEKVEVVNGANAEAIEAAITKHGK